MTLGQGGGQEKEEKELDFAELWLVQVQESTKQQSHLHHRQEMPAKIENNVFVYEHNRYFESEFFNAKVSGNKLH